MSKPHCEHSMLAQGVVSQVEYCAHCDVFHVSVDTLTVRFRATALRDLRDTLSAALANYQSLRGEEPDGPVLPRTGQDVH